MITTWWKSQLKLEKKTASMGIQVTIMRCQHETVWTYPLVNVRMY